MLTRAVSHDPGSDGAKKEATGVGADVGECSTTHRFPNSLISGGEVVLDWNDHHATWGSDIPVAEQQVGRDCHFTSILGSSILPCVVMYCTGNHAVHLSFLVTSLSIGHPQPKTPSHSKSMESGCCIDSFLTIDSVDPVIHSTLTDVFPWLVGAPLPSSHACMDFIYSLFLTFLPPSGLYHSPLLFCTTLWSWLGWECASDPRPPT